MEATESVVDLYSLLKVARDATEEEIHRAYKSLSTTFHPDKLPSTTSLEKREQIQQVFLEFKRANDVLIDPVCRLAYDYYGEEGVALIRRIQQQRRESETRKQATVDIEDDEEEHEDDEVEASLYERIERLLTINPIQARAELERFIEQHEYHQKLIDENQVQLACSMEFPPVVDLKALFFEGRDYLKYVQKASFAPVGLSAEERQYYKQRIQEEQGLIDYQINRMRDSQKAEVGFTLSSVQNRNATTITGGRLRVQPKWSMAMGASTNLIYPGVAKVVTLVGQEEPAQKHPASTFVNMNYQPLPDTQINLTANFSNNQSHQFIVSSSRNFTNRSAFRYNMTFLSKSLLDTNVIMNVKSFRHIKGIGMTSGGFSFGGNGKVLQWNGKWEATRGTTNAHKCSAKVSVGMLQGNSLEVGYKVRCKNISWLEEHITLPRHVELSAIWSRFPKIMGMVTQEFTSLAAHPTLGFGMEHDITFGCWTWIWELTYNNSTFRVPVPVVHLGSISNSDSFYRQKLYYGIYCLLLQSTMADLLKDDEDKIREEDRSKEVSKIADALSHGKSKIDAERQSAMMEKIAERKRVSESRRDGLVILKATYWVDPVVESSPVQACLISMDATNQLQFWVSGGKLSLPSIPKSSWLGFYNLQAHQRQAESRFKWDWRFWRRLTRRAVHPEPLPEPQLTIRYSNSGYIYEITVGEKESLVLPNERAQLLGRASFVQ